MKSPTNWHNYNPADHPGEFNGLPSKTVPDQTLPLKDLVARYVRGENVQTFQAEYSEEDFSQFDKMDRFEKLEAAYEIGQHIDQLRNAVHPSNQPRKQKSQFTEQERMRIEQDQIDHPDPGM